MTSRVSHDGGGITDKILEKDYCPPLDTALFYAVLSDLDPTNPSHVEEVRQTLECLKESAAIEQSTDFDPSGTTGYSGLDDTTDSVNLADLSITEGSGLTSATESSNQTSSLPEAYDSGIEELNDLEKTNLLLELCPEASLFDVQFTLKKYNSSFRKSLDEVLNLAWIKENDSTHKGIDGFFEGSPKSRKRKGKPKSKISHTPEYESQEESHPPRNIWQIKQSQIEYIASRVQLSESLVRSEYHRAGGSQKQTVLNLCKVDLHGILGVSNDDTVVQVNAVELGEDFPSLSSTECLALILLTYPYTARAHELAKIVIANPVSGMSSTLSSSTVVPQYARLQLDNDEPNQASNSHVLLSGNLDQGTLSKNAVAHALHREQMFLKANDAWRKSRSQRLMAGAAAYYSEEGRKANITSRAYSSAIADAHVRGTATVNSIDLHGINVADAVRITQEAVQKWWNSSQAEWAREGKAMGGSVFTVITGAGNHSQGGRAKIRPAVVKLLKAEGWRIEEDSIRGQVIVLGRTRAR